MTRGTEYPRDSENYGCFTEPRTGSPKVLSIISTGIIIIVMVPGTVMKVCIGIIYIYIYQGMYVPYCKYYYLKYIIM